jgi:hypothetical protein
MNDEQQIWEAYKVTNSHMKPIEQGLKSMGKRMADAELNFIETLKELGKITQEQAEKVFDYYLKHKLIKRDVAMGKYNVKNGAYLDKEVIERAAQLVENEQ